MTDNVVKFPQEPTADECLESMKGKLDEVVTVGVMEDGTIVLNGNLEVSETLMLLAMGYRIILDGVFDGDDALH